MLNFHYPLPYPKAKLMILLLLSSNVLIYAVTDNLLNALDALAWVGLLLLYELETANKLDNINKPIQQTLRNGLIALVIVVFISYLGSKAWLDVVNSLLWFALIALLELEIRFPGRVADYQQQFWLVTVAIFLGLISMVICWIWQASWLDAYDASLWIAAFAMIEVDIFHFLQLQRK